MKKTIPDHMRHLMRTKAGVPVPHVASWSSERWGIARMDPLIGKRWALYSEGRQGRGTPLLASINEERQRRSVQMHRCQVCDANLPKRKLFVTTMALHQFDIDGDPVVGTYAPPTCEPCLEWSADICPAFIEPYHVVPFEQCIKILQLVDPSAGPMNKADRFDGGDNPLTRERLGRIAASMADWLVTSNLAFPPSCYWGNRHEQFYRRHPLHRGNAQTPGHRHGR